MTNEKPEWEPYTLDNAVRDICSVSLAPASKSEVRRILQKLLQDYQQRVLGRLPEEGKCHHGKESCGMTISCLATTRKNETLKEARRAVEDTKI